MRIDLGTVSWSNYSHRTDAVNRFTGDIEIQIDY